MSNHLITLTTHDGQVLTFDAQDSQDVISAAATCNITLPSLCRDGGCGACLAHCETGDYQLGNYSESMLPDALKAQRQVLLCRTYPRSNLQLNAPYDYAHIQFGEQLGKTATITQLEKIANRTLKLQLKLGDDDKAVEFEAGQYVEIEIPQTNIRRAYSLANTANWQGELDFLIRLQPQGQFTTFLNEKAAIGQTLTVYAPKGTFEFHSQRFNPAIFIAGGTGLAPFLSMLTKMAQWGENREVHLFFGVNDETELFCLEELAKLQQQLSNLKITQCVWKLCETWQGFSSTPAQALQKYLQENPNDYDIYLCGPPMLVNSCVEIAKTHGISETQIFSEKFG